MARIKRILLIDKKKHVEAEIVLKVANYDVEHCDDVKIAINRYELHRHTSNPFDLIIAVTDSAGQELLKKLYRERFIDYLVLFQRSFGCSKGYCIDGHLAQLCNPVSVLSCVEELQSGLKYRNQSSSCLENAFRQMIDGEMNIRSCI